MSLTLREKDHWKSRISVRIDRAIETLCAANDAGLLERIGIRAKQKAVESLGIAEHERKLEQFKQDQAKLNRKERETRAAMVAIITGIPLEDVNRQAFRDHRINQAINQRKGVHEEELLAADPVGRKILELRREKDDLLDTIWLATSPRQVKELWQHVTDLLDQPPTPLQKQAIDLDPMKSNSDD